MSKVTLFKVDEQKINFPWILQKKGDPNSDSAKS